MNLIFGALLMMLSTLSYGYGALAIDSVTGSLYGFSYEKPTSKDAERAAIRGCGDNCRVVLNINKNCGAYAVDRSRRSMITAWAIGASEKYVKHESKRLCRQAGGENCNVRVWACDAGYSNGARDYERYDRHERDYDRPYR